MSNHLEECINIAKTSFTEKYDYNTIFNSHKFYLSTNENINGYLKLFDFENMKNALSVLASGDHPFNLITKDITNVDTFDINKLTEFYALGIKRSMILKYNYQNYLSNISKISNKKTTFEQIASLIKDIIPYMEKEHNIFWTELIDYLHNNQINKTNLFNTLSKENCNSFNNQYNNYLLNENNYNKLKNNLATTNITFKCCDAINLSKEYNKEYDIILLSNILDYFSEKYGINWNYKELKKYEKSLSKISKNNAYIFLNYVFEYYANEELIFTSSIKKNNLTDEKLIKIPSSPLGGAMLLKRIKK